LMLEIYATKFQQLPTARLRSIRSFGGGGRWG
jgi:hypothetical protein